MGSITFDGVRFAFYSDDHEPPHVHGFYAGVEVVVELGIDLVYLARRKRNIIPRDAKRSDVSHILDTASQHRATLLALRKWH